MSVNSGSGGRASGFDGDGKRPRYSRNNFTRDGAEKAPPGPTASVPMTSSELYELERLVAKYPVQARRFVAALGGDR
jgi:hypothetical protein